MDAETRERFNNMIDLLALELGFTPEQAEKEIRDAAWLANSKLRSIYEKIELIRSYGNPQRV
jgi:hypothetical protein